MPDYPFDDPEVLDIGGGNALREGDEGNLWWWHTDCVDRAYCIVDITSGERHKLLSGSLEDPEHLTIQGSLKCPKGCQRHGFVTSGRWVAA